MNEIELLSRIEAEDLRPFLPDGATVKCTARRAMFSANAQALAFLVIGWAVSIPASIIANAIYDAVKKRSKEPPEAITINKTQVRFERGQITEFIQTQITCGQPNDGRENPQKKEP